ncbi:MAG: energy-coupling factor ABC transporter substrate-binding protein [Candidatus Atribacteria bacterium]|nr:energy-coupling factor ABC transporter substrate-binding protein [Candidatus Atribacteria bacterium]
MKNKNLLVKNLFLILFTVLLMIIPLLTLKNADFEGADAMVGKVITQVNADFKPWFSPLWEPPSGEIETLIFALQAAVGAGFIGYYFGLLKGRKNAHR